MKLILTQEVSGLGAPGDVVEVKGGYGRLVEFPTFDTEWRVKAEGKNRPFVAVSRNGDLVPEAKAVIALVAKHNLILSTGHSTGPTSS